MVLALVSVAIISTTLVISVLVLNYQLGIGFVIVLILTALTLSWANYILIRRMAADQKRLLNNLAHELRTPLSIIRADSEVILLDKDITMPDMVHTLQSNVVEIDRMARIIKNLSNINYLGSNILPTIFTKLDLADNVTATVENLKNFAARKKIKIALREITPTVMWGNAAALEELITNLLRNAIMYSPSGSTIDISLNNIPGGQIELRIQDYGIGISSADLPHVFDPFYRSDKTRNRTESVGHPGLGLTVAREVVHNHNGAINIKSRLGEGTIVTVKFNMQTTAKA